MLAHCQAQVWNGPELARAFGVAHTTVRGYLDRLDMLHAGEHSFPLAEDIRAVSMRRLLADSEISNP